MPLPSTAGTLAGTVALATSLLVPAAAAPPATVAAGGDRPDAPGAPGGPAVWTEPVTSSPSLIRLRPGPESIAYIRQPA